MPVKRIWEHVVARIVQSELITMAIVELAPNSVVPPRRHVNEQLGFVITGSLRFTVDGQTRDRGPGQNVQHALNGHGAGAAREILDHGFGSDGVALDIYGSVSQVLRSIGNYAPEAGVIDALPGRRNGDKGGSTWHSNLVNNQRTTGSQRRSMAGHEHRNPRGMPVIRR